MKTLTTLLALGSCLLLGSCALLTKTSDKRAIYTLRPIEHTPLATMPTFSAHVTSVSIPGYLDRSELVTRSSPNQLDIRHRAVWGDDLQSDIARTLATNLRSLLGTSYIVARDSNLARRDDATRIDLEINRFEPLPGGRQIEFSGLYSLRQSYSPQPARILPFSIILDQAQASATNSATLMSVETMNAALDELSLQIAQALIDRS
ncbi:PqiC family protein [Sulfuriroseicoccus oceanibius]|uniref:Membrane integrity-associated transporter subunit PqiC n=1 Tax=Sulfuriroseicoccus oceanibius TaxID=2707525 RepID=A0A6B3L7L6_9BACT|nr:PqiC family protein [Sulfuriroseicoccus oceanibius]QQL44523.1 membrane integrity-associated transporter subunit PqiC [Sulfuriroseicoccus oceanibius]